MPTVFISYTRSDSWFADKLYQHLHSFRVNDGGEVYLDRRDIAGGELWRDELEQAIAAADAFIVLLSSDYFASSFCYEHELPAIARRYAGKSARVLPVLVAAVAWEDYEFGGVRLGDINAIGPFDGNGKLTPLAEFAAAIQERKFTELAGQIELAVLGRPAREQPRAHPAPDAVEPEEHKRPVLPWLGLAAIVVIAAVVVLQGVKPTGPEAGVDPLVPGPASVEAPPAPPVVDAQPEPEPDDGECLQLDIRSPQLLPSNLIKSIELQESFPYWFRLEGVNECTRSVHLEVSFTLRGGPFILADREPWYHTLGTGETIATNLSPRINVTNDVLHDDEEFLKINLVALNENAILVKETRRILILARPVIIWDLRAPEGGRVPAEFILASLSAWTRVSSDSLQEFARACRGRSTSQRAREPESWVPACYAQMFGDTVSVSGDLFPVNALFARDGRQSILPADDILQSGEANPLEAALALGAIGRVGLEDVRTDLGIIAIRSDGADPALYFVWKKDQRPWSGIELNKVQALPYEENRAAADALIQALLTANPGIATDLEEADGIYIDDEGGVVGINFNVAAQRYSIGDLL